MTPTPITLHCPPAYVEIADRFFEVYSPLKAITCPSEKMKGLKQKQDRCCRFCGQRWPDTTFQSEAHVFPEQIGNRYLISDEECDQCNMLFSKNENDLANFTGPIRHLQGIKGKQRTKYKSPDGSIRVGHMNDLGLADSISVMREDVESNSMEIDKENGGGRLRFIKHSYVPFRVYKAMLKMALSCLDGEDMINYQHAVQFLMSEQLDQRLSPFARIPGYQLPLFSGLDVPVGMIYQKNNPAHEIFTHVFVLYFANQIWQIVLPLNSKDLWLLDGRELSLRFAPPLFTEKAFTDTVAIQEIFHDLSSKELVRGMEESYTYEMDPKDLEHAVIFNPVTGTYTHDVSTFSDVVKLVITKSNTSFSFSPPES